MKSLGWANDEKIAATATWKSSNAAISHRTEPDMRRIVQTIGSAPLT